MIGTPDITMWITLAIIAATVCLYAWERLSIELISLLAIGALLVLFQIRPLPGGRLGPEALLAGLANPALITIVSLLIIGQGLFQTGSFNEPTRYLLAVSERRPKLVLAMTLLLVMGVSAFLNNTPVVVMFIPVLAAMAARLRLAPGKLMIPLSFISVLGGMTTLIGSSTNLLVADAAVGAGLPRLHFFDFTIPALVLAMIGAIYVILIAPYLLPDRAGDEDNGPVRQGIQFVADITVDEDSPLNGTRSAGGFFPELKNITIRVIRRGDTQHLPPFDDLTLQPGDVVALTTSRRALTEMLMTQPDLLINEEDGDAGDPPAASGQMFAEAMVPPGSRMIGNTIDQMAGLTGSPTRIVGIQRRNRMSRAPMSRILLEPGDTVLLVVPADDLPGLSQTRHIVVLEGTSRDMPMLAAARRALIIFAAVIILAATSLLPIVVAVFAGATAMIGLGCLNVRQAFRAVDMRIVLLVATSLAMGTALQETGGAAFIAMGIVSTFSPYGIAATLSALFLMIAILTNILSNNATAVLFTPIAVSAASQLGTDPLPFVFAVIFAANMCFATPMAYQTNLLVMGPGRYAFADYLRVGTPLILILWVLFSLFAPVYFAL